MSGMANFQTNGADIHYDEYGEGFPVLLIAPGGMKSEVSFWNSTPWNPIEQLRGAFRVIAMDQRNAGRLLDRLMPQMGGTRTLRTR